MIQKVTTEQALEICKLYSENLSFTQIVDRIGFSVGTIHRILKKHGIKARSLHKLSEKQKQEIIEKYIAGKSIDKIAKEYDVRFSNIRELLVRRGIKRRTGTETKRFNWPLREDAFDEINEESAYWIGMLMADGCVKNNYICLALMIKDKDHVKKFRDFLGATQHKLRRTRRKKDGKIYWQAVFKVASAKLVQKLAEYGVVPLKTHTAKVCDALKYNKHFWRGVIDGDGSLTTNNKIYPCICLVGSKPLCEQFRDYVKTHIPQCFANVYPTKTIFGFAVAATFAVTIIKELYQNCTVALDRKLERAKKHMEWTGKSVLKCRRNITYNGETKNVGEWARHFGLADSTLRRRLAYGWSLDQAFHGKEVMKRKRYYCRLARKKGISDRTFSRRLKAGMSYEEALNKPLGEKPRKPDPTPEPNIASSVSSDWCI